MYLEECFEIKMFIVLLYRMPFLSRVILSKSLQFFSVMFFYLSLFSWQYWIAHQPAIIHHNIKILLGFIMSETLKGSWYYWLKLLMSPVSSVTKNTVVLQSEKQTNSKYTNYVNSNFQYLLLGDIFYLYSETIPASISLPSG